MARPWFQTLYHFLLNWIRRLWSAIQAWIHRSTGPIITTDTGRRVRLGRQIAEGGFSLVFEATDADQNNNTTSTTTTMYAMKRVSCPDPEILQACRNEAGVHRACRHPNLMPLLGMTIVQSENICYMLFPHLPHSLRNEVNQRTFYNQHHRPPIGMGSSSSSSKTTAPWPSEVTVLKLFYQVCQGVQAMHERAHYSHRDIKLENVLLDHQGGHFSSSSGGGSHNIGSMKPVLMDFGSAGPITQSLRTRRDALEAMEQASIHTTMSYRPPELFEGGVRAGDDDLDYRKVDVWSLGCTLFAMLFGASPFESEFSRSSTGQLQVVECTQLSVLQPVPWPAEHSPAYCWYSIEVHELLVQWLDQDRRKRPGLSQVMEQVQKLIEKKGGRVDDDHHHYHDDARSLVSGGASHYTDDSRSLGRAHGYTDGFHGEDDEDMEGISLTSSVV